MYTRRIFSIIVATCFFASNLSAQNTLSSAHTLSEAQRSIILISAYTAKGELQDLKPALSEGLNAGLTVNEIKEVIVHLYAYCGFPRSIRGLQTFMEVLDEREAKGINDNPGSDASAINQEDDKYERGKKVLGELTKAPQNKPLSGYGAFAPVIDTFLKEHLFADIFERDVLTYAQRELVTISVLSAIGGAEPMLRSHLAICLNVGFTQDQLTEALTIVGGINSRAETAEKDTSGLVFPQGDKITSNNFTGDAWLQMLVNNDSIYNTSIGNVTFKPGARTNWHKHLGGQILLITGGRGFYQEEGKSAVALSKGDVVTIPPDAVHWHGAAAGYSLTHIAISPNTDKGSVVWLNPVTEAEYNIIAVSGFKQDK
jgi:quercetin dioxygenase-like cupin family protein/alkylhydroperoxidase/carboxymuconolactone decarboxylase family protein YurZ